MRLPSGPRRLRSRVLRERGGLRRPGVLPGEPGLRHLEDAADEVGLNAPESLAFQQAVASLAAELSVHERALHRWTLVADALTDPLERAAALLGAAQAALELELEDEARRSLDRAEAIGSADETLAIELASHRADIALALGTRREASRFAGQAAARSRATAAAKGGIEQLDARSLRAYEFAMRVQADAAYNNVSYDEGLAAAEDLVEHAAEEVEVAARVALLDVGGPLQAGVVDFMHLVIVPITLGRGVSLWEGSSGLEDRFTIESVTSPSGLTHQLWNKNDHA